MTGEPPFRAPGLGMSPVLSQLAEVGGERRREMPRDAERFSEDQRQARLEHVFGVAGHNATWLGIGCLFAWTVLVPTCAAISSLEDHPAAAVLGVVAAVAVTIWLPIQMERRQLHRKAVVAEQLAWAGRQPFPVGGYDVWCLSERPLVDVTFQAPIDRQQFANAVAAIDATAQVEWMDERTARVAIPPRTVEVSEYPTSWYADPPALIRLVDGLLRPLHSDVPIVRFEMGGTMHKR